MELKQLQYFTEVVKHGSFSKAAEYLYISQPNISNVIKDLEAELDVKLLIRTTRKLELTDTGKIFISIWTANFPNVTTVLSSVR
jgi:DNA-binding transcriptional LysR family regulator